MLTKLFNQLRGVSLLQERDDDLAFHAALR
jgi:hypothetical protein